VGRIFKTPTDDAVEQTLRAMHTQNIIDNTYEKGLGWLKVLIFSTSTAFVVSAFEYYTDWNLWESTGNWLSEWAQKQLEKLI
jgi:hypothetical protein|tara:strand:+ start:1152 stop:1397 length:246 start_codon:yes stop_codon:yes gene_type:complete